jgi:2-polyprenyl-6-methoxyphenol hydroxylase-like FAD-dependent oxidoreductase
MILELLVADDQGNSIAPLAAVWELRSRCRPPKLELTVTEILKVQCCVVGGGPAGMMLGYLLGRAGVRTVVLEKHADFLRDFRGDTVHPSTLQIMDELGLLGEFLQRPHSEMPALSAEVGDQSFKVADFRHIPGPCKFMAVMPQWDFLNFIHEKGRGFPSLTVMMQSEVLGLIRMAERVAGVACRTPDGPLDIHADLVVGCDGRASIVRAQAGLRVQTVGSPIDVLWFRLSKKPGDPEDVLGRLNSESMIVTIDRTDYWQCAFVIKKGSMETIRATGLDAFRRQVAAAAKFLADRTDELKSFDDIKLLSVAVDRLAVWSKPGLLCIGDAAHAMSPIGGVGINLAVQDAVATANMLAAKLKSGSARDADLDAVRRRRLYPVKVIQSLQVAIQHRILAPTISGAGPIKPPWPLYVLDKSVWLRRWPAQLVGLGVRREHVRSPVA